MHWMCRPWMDKFIEKEKSVLFVVTWKKILVIKIMKKKKGIEEEEENSCTNITSSRVMLTSWLQFLLLIPIWCDSISYFNYEETCTTISFLCASFCLKNIVNTILLQKQSILQIALPYQKTKTWKKRFLAARWMRLLSYSSFNILFQKSFEVGSSGKAIRFLLK